MEAALPEEETSPTGAGPQGPPPRREPTAPPPLRAGPGGGAPYRPCRPPVPRCVSHPNPDGPAGPGTAPPGPAAEFSLEEVTGRWNDMLRLLRSVNHSLEALMRSGRPVSVEGGALLIGFAYPFHRDKVDEEANRRAVEDALTQLLGRPVRVRCVLLAGSGGKPSARPTPARAPTPQPRTPSPASSSPPSPSPSDDGLVQAAVEKLGARIKTN